MSEIVQFLRPNLDVDELVKFKFNFSRRGWVWVSQQLNAAAISKHRSPAFQMHNVLCTPDHFTSPAAQLSRQSRSKVARHNKAQKILREFFWRSRERRIEVVFLIKTLRTMASGAFDQSISLFTKRHLELFMTKGGRMEVRNKLYMSTLVATRYNPVLAT